MPLECSLRPETLKILVVTPEFVSKNCFFADFAIKTLFFVVPHQKLWKFEHFLWWRPFFLVFTPEFVEICDENLCFLVHTLDIGALSFLCPPKICLCPQSRYPGAGPGLHQSSIVFFEVSVSGLGRNEFGPTLPKKENRPSLPRRQHRLHELVLQMYSVWLSTSIEIDFMF